MISSQPAIPLLVHEDCMDNIKTGLADQQASLSEIIDNTNGVNAHLSMIEEKIRMIDENVIDIELNTNSIKTSSSNTATQLGTIKTDTTALASSVGTTADASTENTVIGLLKSISNKITTF